MDLVLTPKRCFANEQLLLRSKQTKIYKEEKKCLTKW